MEKSSPRPVAVGVEFAEPDTIPFDTRYSTAILKSSTDIKYGFKHILQPVYLVYNRGPNG
jgi:hypothetical protein